MPLRNSPWRVPILLLIVLSALVAFDIGTIEIMGNELDSAANWLVVIGLALAFMLSSREMQDMSRAELTSFLTPTAVIILLEFSDRFQDFVEPFGEYFSGLMVILVLLAYYALTNESI